MQRIVARAMIAVMIAGVVVEVTLSALGIFWWPLALGVIAIAAYGIKMFAPFARRSHP